MLLADIGPNSSALIYAIVVFLIVEAIKFWKGVRDARDIAGKVAKVADKVEVQSDNMIEMAKVGQMTHDLVNSAMLEQKRMHMAKCIAAFEDNPSKVNAVEAKTATEAYEEHRKKQEAMAVIESKRTKQLSPEMRQ